MVPDRGASIANRIGQPTSTPGHSLHISLFPRIHFIKALLALSETSLVSKDGRVTSVNDPRVKTWDAFARNRRFPITEARSPSHTNVPTKVEMLSIRHREQDNV